MSGELLVVWGHPPTPDTLESGAEPKIGASRETNLTALSTCFHGQEGEKHRTEYFRKQNDPMNGRPGQQSLPLCSLYFFLPLKHICTMFEQ